MNSIPNRQAGKTADATCINAVHLAKTYMSATPLTVLTDINLQCQRGEIIGIVGSSGTGKTTLLHLLGGLDRPTEGSVSYFGKNIYQGTDAELCRFRNQTVGFMFQFHYLLREFTAVENIMLPGLIGRQDPAALQARATALLDRIGLANRAGHKTGELSGGEQQRVALARALIMEPKVLLADEPTGNLDPKTGQMVFDIIGELNNAMGLTTIIVTHNMELARQMDRCFTLAEGSIRETAPSDIYPGTAAPQTGQR